MRVEKTKMVSKNLSTKPLRLPYSILVPIASVIVWGVLILIPALILFDRLHHLSRGAKSIQVPIGSFTAIVSQSHAFWWSFQMIASLRAPLVDGINLPGFVLHSLASLLLFGSAQWYPAATAPETLRVITTPILCLPAWWFVGSGIEGFFGTRKLRWPALIIGIVLCLFFLALALGFTLAESPQERAETTVPIWSFFFWAAAFAIPVIAWCIQRKSRAETVMAKI